MILLIGILCFVIGLCVGAVLFKQFKSDAVKVEKLEEQLSTLQAEYDHYKNNVNSHFSGTAQLVDNLTESYREVYRHLAAGAHSLCSESISSQLFLSTENNDLIPGNYSNNTANSTPPSYNYSNDSMGADNPTQATDTGNSEKPILPPRDYADKSDPDQKGNLAEDYGLEKVETNQAGELPETPEPGTEPDKTS